MLRRRNSLSKIRLFSAVFLLYLSIHFSPVPIRFSASLVLANRSISQNYTMHDAITITNDNELAAVANSGTGTADDPCIIADWNITGSTTHGISITGTTKHFRVENCWIESSVGYGIFVYSVASGTATIINNTCNNNDEHGIRLGSSGSSTVANNTCNSNGEYGIWLEHSGSSTVANNTCNSNGENGISLWGSGSSTVANNTCNNNYDGSGIRLGDSGSSTVANNTCNNNREHGILFWSSGSSTVANNTSNDNGGIGIFLRSSDYSSIVWNTLVGNGAYGIELSDDSANNVIHHNDFIANGQNTLQACDNGTTNQWYDDTVLEGNYWSDYSGIGNYSIDGSAKAFDPYPSLSPYRYTGETDSSSSSAFPQDVLVRIGLFLVVSGLFVAVLFVNRRKIFS
ncbi:MAG: right-handed parallel beta-helix repeat-containing protein [Candidatus Hodarchaeales archaeon]